MDRLSFLFAKWTHHDSLMYQRANTFWTIQSVSIGAMMIILSSGISNYQMKIVFGVIPILFACVVSKTILNMIKVDSVVRNTFNNRIVKELIDKGDILSENDIKEWNFEEWKPIDNNHPVNLWHTHKPFNKGKSFTRASKFQIIIIYFLIWLEVFGIIGLFIEIFAQRFAN